MKKLKNRLLVLCLCCACITVSLNVITLQVYATSLPETQVPGTAEDIENKVDEKNNTKFPTTSPWLKDNIDDSIYSNNIDASEEKQDIKPEPPGNVEKWFAQLIRNIASSLISLLEDLLGASLDSVIYGRVGSGQPNKVNIFSFELRNGNPYGVTSAIAYSLLRGIAYIFLAMNFVFLLAKSAWSGQTGKSREEIKSNISGMIYKFAALSLMPYVLDIGLYVRDVILYGIKEITGLMVTRGASLNLATNFLRNAERSGTFVDAIMYLGTVGLTVYLVAIYVAVALDLLICFVGFPFVVVFQSRKKDLISNWITIILSDILTPIIDAVLLLIPLLTSVMLGDTIKGAAVIQLVMCALIVKERGKIKTLLGVPTNAQHGFMGAMAMMGLAKAASKAKRGLSKIMDIGQDIQKSKMHGELAEVDREEEQSLLSGFGGESANTHGQDSDIDDTADNFNENGNAEDEHNENDFSSDLEDGETLAESDGINSENPEIDDLTASDISPVELNSDEEYEPSSKNDTGNGDLENTESTVEDEISSDSGEADIRNNKSGKVGAQSGEIIDEEELKEEAVTVEENSDANQGARSKNDIIRGLDSEIEKKQSNLDDLQNERAALVQEDKSLQRDMLDYPRNSEEYKKLERGRADNSIKRAETDQKIADASKNLNQLKSQVRTLKNAGGQGNIITPFDEKRAEIMLKRANIDNFEQPAFKNLSNEQKQQLYKKRAVVNTAKFVASGAGAVVGATTFGGASLFMGPSTTVMSASGGASVGAVATSASIEAGKQIYRHRNNSNTLTGHLMNGVPNTLKSTPTSSVNEVADSVSAVNSLNRSNQQPLNVNVNNSNSVTPTISEARIQQDVSRAVERTISSANGNMQNSSGLKAIQRANIEAEKAVALIKETEGQCSPELERQKRTEIQTHIVTEEILKRMDVDNEYPKDSQEFLIAKEMIRDKIHKIMENKNRPIF